MTFFEHRVGPQSSRRKAALSPFRVRNRIECSTWSWVSSGSSDSKSCIRRRVSPPSARISAVFEPDVPLNGSDVSPCGTSALHHNATFASGKAERRKTPNCGRRLNRSPSRQHQRQGDQPWVTRRTVEAGREPSPCT